MLSVVTEQVTGTNHTYWVYVSNPPINTGVYWEDMGVPVLDNDSSGLPGLYDHQGPAQPAEEGKEIINYTVEIKEIPTCMGNEILCLNVTSQIWLSRIDGRTMQNSYRNS